MDTKALYREILNDHNLNPSHKLPLPLANYQKAGVNPSCGDNITLNLLVTDGVISDATFTGAGCAVSQASADMMIDLIKGKSVDEAAALNATFMKMLTSGESLSDAELESLEDCALLQNVSKMPARVKCAALAWRTLLQIISESLSRGEGASCTTCTNKECCGNPAAVE